MIRSLNLDGAFVPTTHPKIEHELFKFSGGEMHIKLNQLINYDNVEKVVITIRITQGDDIMKVLLAKDALERKGIKSFDLIMPYIPYARQDRQCVDGESFSLKVFANLINSAKFDKVYVLDAHSEVAPGLLNNCVNIENHEFILKSLKNIFPIN